MKEAEGANSTQQDQNDLSISSCFSKDQPQIPVPWHTVLSQFQRKIYQQLSWFMQHDLRDL